jgi:hypothetical protein
MGGGDGEEGGLVGDGEGGERHAATSVKCGVVQHTCDFSSGHISMWCHAIKHLKASRRHLEASIELRRSASRIESSQVVVAYPRARRWRLTPENPSDETGGGGWRVVSGLGRRA